MIVCALTSGALSLLWLLLRTGTKPSRFTYPCQQAALATATAAFGAPVLMLLLMLRRKMISALRTATGKLTFLALAVVSLLALAPASFDHDTDSTFLLPPDNYRASIFVVNDARGIEPGRFGGIDDLITLMGVYGFRWHRSATTSVTSGPDGLIDADDVVLIKVNGQWSERGGTNTDVLRGVIRRIVEHPDGFVGEVIVGENTQDFQPNLDHPENNAEDRGQSIQDVVDDFAGEGWNISTMRWDTFRSLGGTEYSDGDMADRYIVNPVADPETQIKVSYPKFRSASGTYVSYKHGIWSPASQTYDPDKLVVINMPVFKTHATYAITASVKNHMGVVTTRLGTNSHQQVGDGGLGSVLAEVRMPDLNILDCIWILARLGPDEGPPASYENATRRDQLVASTDPVALDVWATKFIMIPQIIDNVYAYDDYHNRQDPDNASSKFRHYLDLSMNELLAAGIETTNDYRAVELHTWGGDTDRDGDIDADDFAGLPECFRGPNEPIVDCRAFDLNADGFIDLSDFAELQRLFTGPGV